MTNSGECPITLIVTEEFKTELKMYCVANKISLQTFGGQVFAEAGKKLMLRASPILKDVKGTGLRRDLRQPLKTTSKGSNHSK